jgi:LacI family transcriptional regulator
MRRSITIKDVARLAGVSVATVSRVCSGGRQVSGSTRRAVETAIQDLGYVPNVAARSLITSRTNAIGVLLPDVYGEVFSEIKRGIDSTTRDRGYHLLVSSSHAQRVDIRAALGSMRGRVDGLIVMSAEDETATEVGELPATVPCTSTSRGSGRARRPSCSTA